MPLFAFGVGPQEMIIIGVIAVLLFGKRLPEVGKSLGKGLVEFKKGLRGIEDDINVASTSKRSSHYNAIDDHEDTTAPRFDPPPAEPRAASEPEPAEKA